MAGTPHRPVLVYVWELTVLIALMAFCLVNTATANNGEFNVGNALEPTLLFLILGVGAWNVARKNSGAIWTPLFWFRVSTAIFFGLGCLAPVIADPYTLQYMRALYNFSPAQAEKLNLIVIFGTVCVLGAAFILDRFFPPKIDDAGIRNGFHDPKGMVSIGIGFVIFGSIIKYLIVLPIQFGLWQVVLPGAVGTLIACSYVGIFLLTAWTVNHRPTAWPMLLAFASFESLTGLLTLSKQSAMTPLMMVCLGVLTKRMSVWRATGVTATVVALFLLLQPLVNHARVELYRHQGSDVATAGERLSYLASYFGRHDSTADRSGVQHGLSRISYVGTATLVMARFDGGAPGNSFRYVWAAFIPRFVWANKPITTDIGNELAQLAARGRTENSISPGWFADAYWNFGWPGVTFVMLSIGALFMVMSRLSLRAIERSDWLSMPILFLGILMGTRVAGFVQTDTIGGLVILCAYMACLPAVRFAIRALGPILSRSKKRIAIA